MRYWKDPAFSRWLFFVTPAIPFPCLVSGPRGEAGYVSQIHFSLQCFSALLENLPRHKCCISHNDVTWFTQDLWFVTHHLKNMRPILQLITSCRVRVEKSQMENGSEWKGLPVCFHEYVTEMETFPDCPVMNAWASRLFSTTHTSPLKFWTVFSLSNLFIEATDLQ